MLFHGLAARVSEGRERISAAVTRGGHGQQVTIVAVTKTHGPGAVRAAWEAGLRDVGENRVQEAVKKMAEVDVPLRWHLIGHLQRNKIKALDHFVLLHSLDSPRRAGAVNQHGLDRQRAVDALVQVNVSGEASKGGFSLEEVAAEAERFVERPGVRLIGVMTMAPLGADERALRRVFQGARTARE